MLSLLIQKNNMHNKENTKEAQEIIARITGELEQQGKTHAELITYLDLPKGIYSSWKAGRSRNFCEHLGEISGFLGVSAEYLVTGKVSNQEIKDSKERELIEMYRKLSGEKQDVILQNIRWLAEK